MRRKHILRALTTSLLIGLLIYLALINFSLPFMSNDEIQFLVASSGKTINNLLISGRYSPLIGIPITEALSFTRPDFPHLLPRLASMLLLALSIFLIIRKLGFSLLAAAVLTTFMLMAHELDWQHNGLIAFYGTYNVLFAAFALALLLNERESSSIWIRVTNILLLIISYTSELFVGLSLCYLILMAWISRRPAAMVRSSVFLSLFIYGTAYLIIKASTTLIPFNAEGMTNYLVGAARTNGIDQMLMAALLYFINSIPYFHELAIPASTSVVISALILIGVSAYLFKVWFSISHTNRTSLEITPTERQWLLAVMLFLLAVVPNFLMALQPSKVEWILSNSSIHYSFSLYTWIGLAIVFAFFTKLNLAQVANDRIKTALSLAAASMLLGGSAVSAVHNIDFTDQYKSSRSKWIEINDILATSRTKELVVSPLYLQHPFISSLGAEQLQEFARKYYDVKLRICRTTREIVMDEEVDQKFVRLDGFAGIESDGRWSEGPSATITLLEESPRINFVELEISAVFQENQNSTLVITKGSKEYRYQLEGIGKFRVDLPALTDGRLQIQLLIPKPVSPSELGLSTDSRKLGLKIRNIWVGLKDSNGEEKLHLMESCQ